jgi:hypothetical protein
VVAQLVLGIWRTRQRRSPAPSVHLSLWAVPHAVAAGATLTGSHHNHTRAWHGQSGSLCSASPCPPPHPRAGPRSSPEYGVGKQDPGSMVCRRALLIEVWSSHSISQPQSQHQVWCLLSMHGHGTSGGGEQFDMCWISSSGCHHQVQLLSRSNNVHWRERLKRCGQFCSKVHFLGVPCPCHTAKPCIA